MDIIERGAAQQGTFNGNPLVAAAGLAALTEVLTPTRTSISPGWARVSPTVAPMPSTPTASPAHTVDLGAKGCVSYRPDAAAQLPRLPRDQ